MTATEARQMALQVTQGKNAEQMKVCEEEIAKAAHSGDLKTTVYFALHQPVAEYLIRDGYKLTPFNDQRDGPSTTISWEL